LVWPTPRAFSGTHCTPAPANSGASCAFGSELPGSTQLMAPSFGGWPGGGAISMQLKTAGGAPVAACRM